MSSYNHVCLTLLHSAYKQTNKKKKMVKLKWVYPSHSCLYSLNWKEVLKVISPLTEREPKKETRNCGSLTAWGLILSCIVNLDFWPNIINDFVTARCLVRPRNTLRWSQNPGSSVGWTRVTVAVLNEQCVRVCARERGVGGWWWRRGHSSTSKQHNLSNSNLRYMQKAHYGSCILNVGELTL